MESGPAKTGITTERIKGAKEHFDSETIAAAFLPSARRDRTAAIARYRDHPADHFASYCGAAPVERGSGQNSRMQINPGGNRRLNWALHVIAIVRLRVDGGRSKQFVERLTSKGKTQRAALRLLKTYIAREIFRSMRQPDASSARES
jgi:transposase